MNVTEQAFLLPGSGLPDAWAWLAGCFAIGLVGTWLARGYSIRHRLIDLPGARRSHDTPTPRGGGVSIVAALLLAVCTMAAADPARAGVYAAIGAGLLLVAGVGWIDDHKPLAAQLRLVAHAVAAGLLAWAVGAAGGSGASIVVAFILALTLVNIWNFMDGIDGLAASQAGLAALGFALLPGVPGPVAWLALALAAACAGFLPFNLPRASIFLGDVGSGAIGFALAALVALLVAGDQGRAPLLLLPLSAFVIDATLTLGSRIVGRERWWQPHTRHAYQRWARGRRSHGVVTWAYAGWTMLAVLAMFVVGGRSPAVIIATSAAIYATGAMIWWRLQRMADMLEPGVRR